MRAYDFVLHFDLADPQEDPARHLEALETVCGDATVGIGAPGKIALAFSRAGQCVEATIQSATDDVQQAIAGAILTRIETAD